jgi:arylsulfatase A-like enzyme
MPDRVEDTADVEHLYDGYDASIRRVDDAVETLLATLEAEGIREETAVVVTADHGEAFGEHGIFAEHAFPHPPVQRVPMVVSWPGVTDGAAGDAVDEQVYQFDLMPTVCEEAGLDVPSGWDAESFAPALRGDGFEGRGTVVAGHGIYAFGRAVYRDDWMYVRLLHPGTFSVPGLYGDPDMPGEGLELLHDLDADPHMTENLIDEEPEVAETMRSELREWLDRHVTEGWRDQRPVSARGEDPLARMASYGPYLYVEPDELLAYYEEKGWDDHVERLSRSVEAFPRSSWTG